MPTQPTITKAATSKTGRLFNKSTNLLAEKLKRITSIIQPTKTTIKWAQSRHPIEKKPLGGKATAKATAARIETTARAKSAISNFKTVIQNTPSFLLGT